MLRPPTRWPRINDVYGHAAGDIAIKSVAQKLQTIFRVPALVGRIGGDEFLVLTKTESQSALRERLMPVVTGLPLENSDRANGLSKVACSVGVTYPPKGDLDLELLVNEADEAMYFAKRRASGVQFYDKVMRAQTQRRRELAGQLKKDIFEGLVTPMFQPIFCASSGDVVAFEALARWGTPELGSVPPSEFLAVAHNTGIL